ncbi:MAG: FKBP-type peptidyl-prolyl cis-trans isomerase [Alistipes sp.]|nr:FKBP-type peptidyl-prolyl cis-trans isomerase [Alistipes sp.]
MKSKIWIAFVVAASLLFSVACGDEAVDMAETQRNSIVSYLTSSHSPRLINKKDVGQALEKNPPFYEQVEYNTFRYIDDYYNPERESRVQVAEGDEVELTFTAYIFSGSKPAVSAIYLTNDQVQIDALQNTGLNVEYWKAEPLRVKIGQTNIIKGVEVSLIGCREGDSVEVYMTLDAAYGDDVVGVVPLESSVVWYYTIDKVVR